VRRGAAGLAIPNLAHEFSGALPPTGRPGIHALVPAMNLVSVYRVKKAAQVLYELLASRDKAVNISHDGMPTFKQHQRFVRSHPYPAWYLIEVGQRFVGAIYLSAQNEIGVFLFPQFQSRGHGPEAIRLIMERHPRGRFLANVNPSNTKSARLFRRLGFH